ncbi:hypothetical protein ACHAXT_009935 [Thalassiosira profunda]
MKRPRPQLTSPLLPEGVDVIVPPPPFEACTFIDKLLVYASSLVVVGSPLWFYGGVVYLYKKWKRYRALAALSKEGVVEDDDCIEQENYTSSGESSQERPDGMQRYTSYRKMAIKYGAALAMLLCLSIWGPHRSERLGRLLDVRRWRLWDAWLNYVGFTVLHDRGEGGGSVAKPTQKQREFDMQTSPAIFAFIPHGIFPFGLAFSCLPQRGYEHTWGLFRPVVATATRLFPLVRTFIAWMGGVDASRSAVSAALSQQTNPRTPYPRRVGISPGGIAEMFETYPKPGFHPNDEAALLKHRDGMFKLALKHDVPIVPVYCFGATKMFKRLQLPHFIETLSRALQISLCILFGKLGLPIPFRQRMVYVIGKTIWPSGNLSGEEFDRRVKEMHDAFCNEILRIFDRNKTHYGWENKTLRLV